MADYKLGFFGEEIDVKLQQIEELRGGITQLQQNNETITAAIERINVAIEALQNAGTGAIRHIQRGRVTTTSNADDTITITGFTNSEKMIVLFNGDRYTGATYNSAYYGPQVLSLTADTLIVTSPQHRSDSYNTYAYQVIEFY